MEKEDN